MSILEVGRINKRDLTYYRVHHGLRTFYYAPIAMQGFSILDLLVPVEVRTLPVFL